jgi:protein SCO1
MPSQAMLRRVLLLAALGLAGVVAAMPATAAPGHDGEAAAGAAPAQFDERAALRVSQSVIGKRIGEHELTDRAGRRVTLSEYRGRPLIVSFIYTGCTHACPVATNFLARAVGEAQRTLGAQSFAVLTIGFNLPFDTPQAMADFARRHGVERPGWEFASATVGGVERLTRDFGFAFVPASGGFEHLAQVTVVDAEGVVRRQVYGETFDLPYLIEPLREMVTGAPLSELTWSQALDRIRILCTVYDPASGRYRLDYRLFVEILAGFTVIGGVLLYLRSGRIRRRTAVSGKR